MTSDFVVVTCVVLYSWNLPDSSQLRSAVFRTKRILLVVTFQINADTCSHNAFPVHHTVSCVFCGIALLCDQALTHHFEACAFKRSIGF